MNQKEIVQDGDPVLREHAQAIAAPDITQNTIQTVIQEMKDALATQADGVALAAPQIGYSLRIFVVAPFAYGEYTNQPLVFINPKLIKTSRKRDWIEEGCLSVRWKYGEAHRYDKATVEAYNEEGKKFTWGGSGLIAQIFQHEIDHLDGILFHDHARNVYEMTDEEITAYQQQMEHGS